MDYRDVLATVAGASIAGIIAFAIRLIFPVNAAVLALIYAATYSLLGSIVGDHAKLLFHRYLPERTPFDGHWRIVTGSIALLAAASAGLIVAFAVSSRSSFSDPEPTQSTPRLIIRTVELQPHVVINGKTIVMPVETTIVTTPIKSTGDTDTITSRTVVVERPPITVTVDSTRETRTLTQTTAEVIEPDTTTAPETASEPSITAPAVTPAGTDDVPTDAATEAAPAP